MRIDHVALCTRDLARAKVFYESYFGAEAAPEYHNPKTGLRLHFLRFPDGGAMLELMQWPDVPDARLEAPHLGYLHISFKAGSRAAVDALTGRLRQDGYPVLSGPRVTGDGQYESCVRDPDGNLVEIVA